MRIKALAGAVAALALIAGSAQAADLYNNSGGLKDGQAPTPAPLSGFYVSVLVGGAFSDITDGGTNWTPSGVVGRGVVGFDGTLPNGWLLGLYGEFGGQDTPIFSGSSVSQRLEWGAGVKAGYQIGKSTVLFTRVGYASLELAGSGGFDEYLSGIAVTPGIDYALGGGWSATGEVRIGIYPEQDIKGTAVKNTVIEPTVGITYHFGQQAASSLK